MSKTISDVTVTEKINTGGMLAWLILSETIPSVLLPYDAFEAELFFNHNFKRSKKDIFKRYCEYHHQNPDELLDYYKTISKIEKQYVPIKSQQNKRTVDALVSIIIILRIRCTSLYNLLCWSPFTFEINE